MVAGPGSLLQEEPGRNRVAPVLRAPLWGPCSWESPRQGQGLAPGVTRAAGRANVPEVEGMPRATRARAPKARQREQWAQRPGSWARCLWLAAEAVGLGGEGAAGGQAANGLASLCSHTGFEGRRAPGLQEKPCPRGPSGLSHAERLCCMNPAQNEPMRGATPATGG